MMIGTQKMAAALVALTLAACAHTATETPSRVAVYRSDGSRQCSGGGMTPQAMQGLLEGAGIRVYAARKDHLRDVAFPAVCGGATGSVNVYIIAAGDSARAQSQGFAIWPYGE